MPRPRSIPWAKRVSIFLDYRQLKKFYPTAKRHMVARSTVDLIVKEFTEQGFAKEPRPNLSPMILAQLQEHHLQEVLRGLRTPPTVHLTEPRANFRAGIEPEEALGEGAPLKVSQRDPLSVGEVLLWHLKGTGAERTLEEAQKAIRDYDQRCLALWRDIGSALMEACSLPARAYRSRPDWGDREPHIPHELVDLVYHDAFDATPSYQLEPQNWRPAPDDPPVLMAGSRTAVVGETAHDAVRQGVALFLTRTFGECQRRATELTRLHHDLQYVTVIVQEALQRTTPEEVRRGICPVCPYPEARQEPSLGNQQGETSEGGDNGQR
ncbi:MAG: hypothetical protein V3U26_07315 [Dehalococcoidia bacterium]